jgi:5-methylcytosine-specific restriction endonuclease McrA
VRLEKINNSCARRLNTSIHGVEMVLPRPCAGCGRVVRASRCDDCKRVLERARPTRIQRGYDYAWNKLSKAIRERHPYCAIEGCKNKDLTVDHILPLSVAPWLRLEPTNLQVLCRSHNSQKGRE